MPHLHGWNFTHADFLKAQIPRKPRAGKGWVETSRQSLNLAIPVSSPFLPACLPQQQQQQPIERRRAPPPREAGLEPGVHQLRGRRIIGGPRRACARTLRASPPARRSLGLSLFLLPQFAKGDGRTLRSGGVKVLQPRGRRIVVGVVGGAGGEGGSRGAS